LRAIDGYNPIELFIERQRCMPMSSAGMNSQEFMPASFLKNNDYNALQAIPTLRWPAERQAKKGLTKTPKPTILVIITNKICQVFLGFQPHIPHDPSEKGDLGRSPKESPAPFGR
jgi:hypothetical protein